MVYVYDLNNCAAEFGFKPEEGWELSAVSDSGKIDLEKRYYPTVSVKVLPEVLSELFRLVKDQSANLRSGIKNSIGAASLPDQSLQYLVAYNPGRLLR